MAKPCQKSASSSFLNFLLPQRFRPFERLRKYAQWLLSRLLFLNQIFFNHPIQENLCFSLVSYPHCIILYAVVASPSLLVFLWRINCWQENQAVLRLFLFVKLLSKSLFLLLPLWVERDHCLTESMLHVDVLWDFLDLSHFLLSWLLRDKINLENDVVSVLCFYYWGVSFFVRVLSSQVHSDRIG